MGITNLEKAVLAELREVANEPKLRLKNVREYSTAESVVKKNLQEEDGEEMIRLPELGLWAAFIRPAKKKAKRKCS